MSSFGNATMAPEPNQNHTYGPGRDRDQKYMAYTAQSAATAAKEANPMSGVSNTLAGLSINGGQVGHMGLLPGLGLNAGMPFMPMHHAGGIDPSHFYHGGFHPQHPTGQLGFPIGVPYYPREATFGLPHVLGDPGNVRTDPSQLLIGDLAAYDPRVKAFMQKQHYEEGAPVPGLDNRRSSYSTNESQPTTPFFSSTAPRDATAQIAVFDNRSGYTTPSPQQLASANLATKAIAGVAAPILDADLNELLQQDPPIPRAIPAVFTPKENMKTLEQSLVNQIPGNRNVYIRGLHPTTDDDLLYKYTERFGPVETSKAIIDNSQGSCKGFGFAKFKEVRDSERCIRGFYALGYEVGFARVNTSAPATGDDKPARREVAMLPDDLLPRLVPLDIVTSPRTTMKRQCLCECFMHSYLLTPPELEMCYCICANHPPHFTDFIAHDQESFNSRLKAEGDDNSTNLYFSNLPKSMTEASLATVFMGYTILSSKILRDNSGNSRGVGFARFETREICNEIIENFTNEPMGEERLPMQIRYADTPAQKELKRVTAERRQFRTNEYNVGAYGTALVGISPNIYGQPQYRPRHMPAAMSGMPNTSTVHVQPAQAAHGTTRSATPAAASSTEEVECSTLRVDSPLVAHGSTQSSPIKNAKKEKEDH